jgi:hypothetical protein
MWLVCLSGRQDGDDQVDGRPIADYVAVSLDFEVNVDNDQGEILVALHQFTTSQRPKEGVQERCDEPERQYQSL